MDIRDERPEDIDAIRQITLSLSFACKSFAITKITDHYQ